MYIFSINNTCQSRCHRSNSAEHFNRGDFHHPRLPPQTGIVCSPALLRFSWTNCQRTTVGDATQPSSSDIASARAPTTIARDLANWILQLHRPASIGELCRDVQGPQSRVRACDGRILQRKKKVMALSYQYKHNVRRELRRYKAAQIARRRRRYPRERETR